MFAPIEKVKLSLKARPDFLKQLELALTSPLPSYSSSNKSLDAILTTSSDHVYQNPLKNANSTSNATTNHTISTPTQRIIHESHNEIEDQKLVESIQSNLEKINLLKLDLEKNLLKYNDKASSLLTKTKDASSPHLTQEHSHSGLGRSKSTPQKLIKPERKHSTKSKLNDVYRSSLLNRHAKMILNRMNSEKNDHTHSPPVSKPLDHLLSSSSSSSSSASLCSNAKKGDTPKKGLLSLKNFHLKIPKFASSANSSDSKETVTITTTANSKPIDSSKIASANNEKTTNLELVKQNELTGM